MYQLISILAQTHSFHLKNFYQSIIVLMKIYQVINKDDHAADFTSIFYEN